MSQGNVEKHAALRREKDKDLIEQLLYHLNDYMVFEGIDDPERQILLIFTESKLQQNPIFWNFNTYFLNNFLKYNYIIIHTFTAIQLLQ